MYLNNSNKSESKRVYLNVLTKAEKDAKTKKKIKAINSYLYFAINTE